MGGKNKVRCCCAVPAHCHVFIDGWAYAVVLSAH